MEHTLAHHEHHDSNTTDIFGFWLYIMSDCILFATLFATFIVMHTSVYGGPGMKELTNIPDVFKETIALLISSFTYGLAMLALYQRKTKSVMFWIAITFLFGLSFVAMEVTEFVHLYMEGHSWQSSGALSAFFTLVGTHGLHVSIGLVWMLLTLLQLAVFGPNAMMQRRLTYLGFFWAFLDIVWIFVFTIVYLVGAV